MGHPVYQIRDVALHQKFAGRHAIRPLLLDVTVQNPWELNHALRIAIMSTKSVFEIESVRLNHVRCWDGSACVSHLIFNFECDKFEEFLRE